MRGKSLLVIAVGLIGFVGCHTNSCTRSYAPTGPSCLNAQCPAPSRQPASFSLFGPIVSNRRLVQGTAPWPLQYAYNLGVSGSQFGNTLLGGDPDESLSSRFGRAEADEVAIVKDGIAPALDLLLGPDHCQQAAEQSQTHTREVWAWRGSSGGEQIIIGDGTDRLPVDNR